MEVFKDMPVVVLALIGAFLILKMQIAFFKEQMSADRAMFKGALDDLGKEIESVGAVVSGNNSKIDDVQDSLDRFRESLGHVPGQSNQQRRRKPPDCGNGSSVHPVIT